SDPAFDRLDLDQWIDRRQPTARRRDLRRADVSRRIEDLPLQIGEIDAIGIGEDQGADAGRREKLGNGCTQTADADDERPRRGETLLRLDAELGEQDVPAVAQERGVVQRKGIAVHVRTRLRDDSATAVNGPTRPNENARLRRAFRRGDPLYLIALPAP